MTVDLLAGGRKFFLTIFAILLAFLLALIAIAVTVKHPESSAAVTGVATGFTSVLMVALAFFNGANAAIEWKHASKSSTSSERRDTTHREHRTDEEILSRRHDGIEETP